jgi:carboxypeptidase Q
VTAHPTRGLTLTSFIVALAVALPVAQRSAELPATPPPPAMQTAVAGERVDLDVVYRIKEEGLQRSQVMDTAWYLTDVHGPRLTNSPRMHQAADWTVERLKEWGISARKETWGQFGRGWANERFMANEISPLPAPLLASPRAWTPGVEGTVTADVVLAVVANEADLKRWDGQLKGKIVLAQNPPDVRALFTPLGRRYTDQELAELESQPVTAPRLSPPGERGRGAGPGGAPPAPAAPLTAQRRMQWYAQQGVVAVLEPGTGRSDHGAIVVQGPSANRNAKEPPVAPQIVVATEQYNRLARLAARNHAIRLELTVQNRFYDDTLDAYNIIAELPGTDRAEEVVMLGAHFDSWHAGTGATDNASGVAAMMEAMRILKTINMPLRRTVRLALWTGEEQGLLGSTAYVRTHFANRETMVLTPAHARLSAYFNMDNGTGAIRGIYLQGNEAIRPVFQAWMEPFRNMGMTTLAIRDTRSTDHVPFNDVGLPGFQFIQDPVEYGTHSHHTNMDVYDRLQGEDLAKNAAIIASFVYHAATRDDVLPRKPLPAPAPPPRGGGRGNAGNTTQ